MRYDANETRRIVEARNRKLAQQRTSRVRTSAPLDLGPASPELLRAMRALDAGMRNHRHR